MNLVLATVVTTVLGVLWVACIYERVHSRPTQAQNLAVMLAALLWGIGMALLYVVSRR